MLKHLIEFFGLLGRDERIKLFQIQFMIIFSSLLETLSVLSIGPFMTIVSSPEVVFSNRFFLEVSTFLNIQEPNNFLIMFGGAILILMVLSAFFSMITIWRLSILGGKIGANLSSRMFKHYITLPFSFHLKTNSSELASKLIVESNRMTHSVVLQLLYLNSKIVLILLMILTILITVPIIAIVSTILFFGCYVALYGFASNRLNRNGEVISLESRSRMQTINEGFGGIKDVLIYGLQKNFINKYTQSTENYYASWSSNQVLSLLPRYAIEFAAYATMISAVIFLLFSFDNNISKLLPVIAVFGLASMKLLPAFQQCYFSVSTMRANINAFFVVRDELLDIHNQENIVKKNNVSDNDITFLKSVTLNNVSFYYDKKQNYILKDISIEFKANQTTGIVGASGSGKSTIINILTGLLPPSSGLVEVDGHELTESNLRSWQKKIGFVSQNIFLLDASIRENIAFGNRAKDIDPKRMDQVIEMSQLDDFISTLPKGLETGVGERGVQLSGGQLQRVGIARALYCNPEIIVFDEATSNLDRISEKLIMETIASLRNSTTIIMIAHRLSTVKECDNIFLLNDGQVENSGNYEYLINNSSQFFNLT